MPVVVAQGRLHLRHAHEPLGAEQLFDALVARDRLNQLGKFAVDRHQLRVQAVVGVDDELVVAQDVDVAQGEFEIGRPLRGGEEDVAGNGAVGPVHRGDRVAERGLFVDGAHGKVVRDANRAAGGRQGVHADAHASVVAADVGDEARLGDVHQRRLASRAARQHDREGIQRGVVVPVLRGNRPALNAALGSDGKGRTARVLLRAKLIAHLQEHHLVERNARPLAHAAQLVEHVGRVRSRAIHALAAYVHGALARNAHGLVDAL